MHARVVAVLLPLLSVSACSRADRTGPAPVSPETAAAVKEVADSAVTGLTHALQAHLVAAMQEGGPVHAIEFCSMEALPITDSVAASFGGGIEIKRTSSKIRNPHNAPDLLEEEALAHLDQVREETGELPADWVQKTADGDYRYYRSLTVLPPCLTCHGKPAAMDSAVVAVLHEKYPEDEATGYAVGDFRGVIRVTVPPDRIGS